MGQRQGKQHSAVAAPFSSVSHSPSPATSFFAQGPQPPSRHDFADLERMARFGHRFDALPTHSSAPAAGEPSGAPSAGHPLPTQIRGRFERAFGADFSDVRVHHESTIPPSPLRAFTRGAHLHFAPTRFRPGTAEGDALIGHELAHVTQQRERRVASDGGEHGAFNTQPHLEKEARQMGERAARGETAPVGASAARPHAAPGPAPVQAGLFDLLGPANPRLYAPTWLGGHSRQHLAEREWQGRSGPMDMLGPANPRRYLPTRLGGHSEQHLAERELQGRSGPLDLLGPLNPRRHLPTRLGGHSVDELRRKDHSPEELLKRHPSTFLRSYGINSDAEWAGAADDQLPSRTDQPYFLSRYPAYTKYRPGYTLHRANDPRNDQIRNPIGPRFNAAFLPMRQMARDDDAPNTVAPHGQVRDTDLDNAHENVTLTAQLSGCSVTHQGGCLRHLRPADSGVDLHNNLEQATPGSTYGRNDYPRTSFVMMKKKQNGRTRVYHQLNNNPATSGNRDIG